MSKHMQTVMQNDALAMLRTDGRTNGRSTHLARSSSVPERVREIHIDEAQLEQTRRILSAQATWCEAKWGAYQDRVRAGLFETWADGRDWLDTLPRLPLEPLGQLVWAESEYRRTHQTSGRPASLSVPKVRRTPKKNPIIPEDRQLEIALAALARTARKETAA